MNWVSPKHAVSDTPSRFAINVRWGKEAPPRIVAQNVGGTQRVNVLDLVIVVNGRRQPISQKYNDLGQLAKSTDNICWAQ